MSLLLVSITGLFEAGQLQSFRKMWVSLKFAIAQVAGRTNPFSVSFAVFLYFWRGFL